MASNQPIIPPNVGSYAGPIIVILAIASGATLFMREVVIHSLDEVKRRVESDNAKAKEPFYLHLIDLFPGARK